MRLPGPNGGGGGTPTRWMVVRPLIGGCGGGGGGDGTPCPLRWKEMGPGTVGGGGWWDSLPLVVEEDGNPYLLLVEGDGTLYP